MKPEHMPSTASCSAFAATLPHVASVSAEYVWVLVAAEPSTSTALVQYVSRPTTTIMAVPAREPIKK